MEKNNSKRNLIRYVHTNSFSRIPSFKSSTVESRTKYYWILGILCAIVVLIGLYSVIF